MKKIERRKEGSKKYKWKKKRREVIEVANMGKEKLRRKREKKGKKIVQKIMERI